MAALPCLPACASRRIYRTTVQNGVVRVPVRELDALTSPIDTLLVRVDGRPPLLVRPAGDAEARFTAVTARCTHSGCLVRAEPDGYVCPCHGSSFANDGQVIDGPARLPLTGYQVETSAGELLIRLAP